MAQPSGNYDRVGNFGQVNSSSGLKEMHGGEISANSARKIRNAIDWLIASASEKYVYSKKTNRFHKWKLSFLTLTLPTQGTTTDIEVKSILNSFLTLAKYNYGLHSYIWKAEPQKRGVIHFHITSDCYMWKNSVRYEWNRLLSKHGLNNGHTDAPSTKYIAHISSRMWQVIFVSISLKEFRDSKNRLTLAGIKTHLIVPLAVLLHAVQILLACFILALLLGGFGVAVILFQRLAECLIR